ncbi:MAG TPA: hypothetical protein VJ810_01240, partial [Blastocatellia bacterium]|nr:hypothetical protein [Blastocatellia bacterium]
MHTRLTRDDVESVRNLIAGNQIDAALAAMNRWYQTSLMPEADRNKFTECQRRFKELDNGRLGNSLTTEQVSTGMTLLTESLLNLLDSGRDALNQIAEPSIEISRIIKYAPVELIGREAETALLNDAWDKVQHHAAKRQHILTFVALGGEGKTSLVAKWAADLAHRGWPGCDAVFAWSFYSQGTREQTAASSDLFLSEALTVFGDASMAGSAAGAFDKGRRLAQLVGEQRALLILDGLEPLQYAPTSPTPGELKDQGLAALLKGLAANNHGLCVVTTRYAIP